MPIVGLIGGIAPASTVDYYGRIIAAYRERITDGSYPRVIINSIDLTAMLRLVEGGRLEELTNDLLGELRRLQAAGADFSLLASNTPHIVFDELRARSPLPLVSIVEAACAAAEREGYTRVGLLGTRFTMAGRFYPSVFEKSGIEIVTPEPAEQDYVHGTYMGELVRGQFLPETRRSFVELVNRLHTRDHVDAILLAGTELPLLLRDAALACPVLDTTALHVDAVVARLLAMPGGTLESV